jgi:hypothetical protein
MPVLDRVLIVVHYKIRKNKNVLSLHEQEGPGFQPAVLGRPGLVPRDTAVAAIGLTPSRCVGWILPHKNMNTVLQPLQ